MGPKKMHQVWSGQVPWRKSCRTRREGNLQRTWSSCALGPGSSRCRQSVSLGSNLIGLWRRLVSVIPTRVACTEAEGVQNQRTMLVAAPVLVVLVRLRLTSGGREALQAGTISESTTWFTSSSGTSRLTVSNSPSGHKFIHTFSHKHD